MENAYFRSYIRRYACTPQEIRKALKVSTENDDIEELLLQDSIEEEIINSTSGADNNGYGEPGDPIFIAKSCPPHLASTYCYNGGTCYVDYYADNHYLPFCKCAPGWEGRQCQRSYNPRLYESARVAPDDIGTASVGTLMTVLFVGLLVFLGLIYLSKTLCKSHDLRDYMCSEASYDPNTMTPVQLYPFSRRSPQTQFNQTPFSTL